MLLIPLLAMSLAGCGGGGSDDDVVVTGGTFNNGGGGGTPPPPPSPPPPPGSRTFTYPAFPVNGRLTLVSPFQPPAETSTTSAEVVATIAQGGSLARMLLGRSSVADEEPGTAIAQSRCGTADVSTLAKLMGDAPEPRAQAAPGVRARFEDLPEGAQREFFLITIFKKVTAEKVLAPEETVHCTIFAELDEQGEPCLSRAKALQIAQAFDTNNPNRPGSGIYDQVRAAFGSEWNANGGIDGDGKVVLFFFRSQTLGTRLFGYTSPIDGTPGAGELSNQGEIVYVNADKDLTQTLSTLVHEFQHLINQNEKISRQGTFPAGAQEENVTINEGLSQLAEEICGFDFNSNNTLLVDVCNDYLRRPEEHEFFNFNAAGLGYGQGYLFFKYVREHFGDSTIRAITTSPQVGKANLDALLQPGFAETFRRWTVANYATNLGGAVPSIYRYPSGFRTDGSYPAGQLRGVQTYPMGGGTNGSGSLGAWSVTYLTFDQGTGQNLTVSVETAPNSPIGALFESARGTFTRFDQ